MGARVEGVGGSVSCKQRGMYKDKALKTGGLELSENHLVVLASEQQGANESRLTYRVHASVAGVLK